MNFPPPWEASDADSTRVLSDSSHFPITPKPNLCISGAGMVPGGQGWCRVRDSNPRPSVCENGMRPLKSRGAFAVCCIDVAAASLLTRPGAAPLSLWARAASPEATHARQPQARTRHRWTGQVAVRSLSNVSRGGTLERPVFPL
jgi:hypothetical protein